MKLLLLAVFVAGVCGFAQTADVQKRIDELERELAASRRLLMDWGGLVHYGSDNSELKKPAPGVKRVVFIGDDVTEHWGEVEGTEGAPKFFPGKPYLNRGISRQTTGQMLIRFRQDVIDLSPAVVMIQGGSNDIARHAGPASEETIADNFQTMAELAKAHGIKVVLASVLPVCDCGGHTVVAFRPPGRIIGLNGWMKSYAAKNGIPYINYYQALVEGRAMKAAYSADGFVPSEAGYAVMAPLAEAAITEALK